MNTIYCGFMLSHITFGISLYGRSSNEELHKLLLSFIKRSNSDYLLRWNESVKQNFADVSIMTVCV